MRHVNTATDSDVVARIGEALAERLGPRRYAMWFERSACLVPEPDGPSLRVEVPSRFAADWIQRHFREDLRQVVDAEMGPEVELELNVAPQRFDAPEASADPSPGPAEAGGSAQAGPGRGASPSTAAAGARRGPLGSRLRHSLEDFVVGPSNELAYAAAVRLADADAEPGHPLFLHGGCGLGKTHLLQGMCKRLLKRQPQARVHYTTGEQFTNDYISAVRGNRLEEFRRRIRRLDLLAVDDVHFIANKQSTQQEFLHSFDQIELGGARVALASDSHPKFIEQFSEALVSRCVRGLVVRIAEPDAETRRRLVEVLARRRGLALHESAAAALGKCCGGSVREIEGTLTKLQALVSLAGGHRAGEPVGHAMIDHLLASDAAMRPARPVTLEMVLEAVAERLGVTRQQILGQSRHKLVVLARSVAIHLARELTPLSFPEIARAMGRRNHSTIITAAQRIARQLGAADAAPLPPTLNAASLADLVDELRRRLQRGT